MLGRVLVFLMFCGCLSTTDLVAQEKYYRVFFTDKANSTFSIDQPEAFLSQRSLDRRNRQNIPINEDDLPVSPVYLDSLKALGALEIHHCSKWTNSTTILSAPQQIEIFQSLAFVDSIEYVGRTYKNRIKLKEAFSDSLTFDSILETTYGYAFPQIQMLNGETLHERGYRGEGMWVAVLDGGFAKVSQIPFLDSLEQQQRLHAAYDFVDKDTLPYESSSHGTQVLSLMAANKPYLMVGTAPEASYSCFKTEDTRGEYRLEECNWIAALERADSLGVDIINSSLGYNTFSNDTMNYAYPDLDGKKSLTSKAADMAFERGMIVVTSAGNEGNSSWKHITVPADAEKVLSVGSVTLKGKKSSFSSIGPTADERIKPDVAAFGNWVAVPSINSYSLELVIGTSFSTPILCGMVACLWQAFPEKTNQEIVDAIKQSSSQADDPDNRIGFGIPDFEAAFKLLSAKP